MIFGSQDDGALRAGNYSAIDHIKQMGGNRLRMVVSRERVAKEGYGQLDNILNEAKAKGVDVQMVLDNREGFGRGAGDPKKYERFVKDASTHFKGRVGTYSFINEPDIKMSSQKYRQFFLAGQKALADKNARVLFGEFSPHEAHKALKGSEHSATSLIAQGIVKADKKDLQAYINELEAHHPSLKPAEKHANKKLRKELQKVVDNPKADLTKAKAAGERYAKVISKRERGLVGHGMLTEEQSLRAKLIPYATRHMEARHEPEHWVDSKGEKVPKSEVDTWRRLDPEAARTEYTKVPAQMVTKEGKPLSTEAILKHYKENHSGELPAFVTHRERNRGSFNIRSEQAPSMGTGVRTGKATKAGLFDTSHANRNDNQADG